jgi:hypothetical protein
VCDLRPVARYNSAAVDPLHSAATRRSFFDRGAAAARLAEIAVLHEIKGRTTLHEFRNNSAMIR